MNTIPSVDLDDFISGDPKRKQKFVDQIGSAYEDIGFVSLKNHFLDDQLTAHLYNEIKAFLNFRKKLRRNTRLKNFTVSAVIFPLEKSTPRAKRRRSKGILAFRARA